MKLDEAASPFRSREIKASAAQPLSIQQASIETRLVGIARPAAGPCQNDKSRRSGRTFRGCAREYPVGRAASQKGANATVSHSATVDSKIASTISAETHA